MDKCCRCGQESRGRIKVITQFEIAPIPIDNKNLELFYAIELVDKWCDIYECRSPMRILMREVFLIFYEYNVQIQNAKNEEEKQKAKIERQKKLIEIGVSGEECSPNLGWLNCHLPIKCRYFSIRKINLTENFKKKLEYIRKQGILARIENY